MARCCYLEWPWKYGRSATRRKSLGIYCIQRQKTSQHVVSVAQKNSEGVDGVEEGGMVEFSCKKHAACEACSNLSEDAEPVCPQCASSEIATSEADVQCTAGVQQPPSSKVSALLRNIVKMFENQDSEDGTRIPAKTYV